MYTVRKDVRQIYIHIHINGKSRLVLEKMFQHQWGEPPRTPHKCFGTIKSEIFNRLYVQIIFHTAVCEVAEFILYDCAYVPIVSGCLS